MTGNRAFVDSNFRSTGDPKSEPVEWRLRPSNELLVVARYVCRYSRRGHFESKARLTAQAKPKVEPVTMLIWTPKQC